MNRYDVFQLVQELGRLIEGVHDKTLEEVARELIACGEKRLAEARAQDGPNQPTNGTSIPLPTTDPAVILESENSGRPVAAPDSASAVRA